MAASFQYVQYFVKSSGGHGGPGVKYEVRKRLNEYDKQEFVDVHDELLKVGVPEIANITFFNK